MKFLLQIGVAVILCFFAGQVLAVETIDTDGDGLNDDIEIILGTDVNNSDSDGDGFLDGTEVQNGYHPLKGAGDRSWPRRAEVDISKQRLYYFLNNVKVGDLPVSTGIWRWPTPTGEFKILRKLPSHRYTGAGYDYPNTKWNLEFKRSFYLHGAYWHNQFGIRPMSHGCVNIATADAEKLYKFMSVGDMVKVYGRLPKNNLVVTQAAAN